jgi:hypothetical protein
LRVERAVLSSIRYLCVDNSFNKAQFSELNIGADMTSYILSHVREKPKAPEVISVGASAGGEEDEVDDLEDLIVEDKGGVVAADSVDVMVDQTLSTEEEDNVTSSEILNQALYVLAAVTMAHGTFVEPSKHEVFVIFDILKKCKRSFLSSTVINKEEVEKGVVVDEETFAKDDISSIMLTCFDILSDICHHEGNVQLMYTSDISIVTYLYGFLSLEQCQSSPLLMSSLLSILSAICSSLESIMFVKEVIALDLIPLILEIYNAELKKDDAAIEAIMKFFCSIAVSDPAISKIPLLASKQGLIDFIFDNMENNKGEATKIAVCLELIQSLMKMSSSFIMKFSEESTLCDSLLSVLSQHISNTSAPPGLSYAICVKCCALVRILCLHDAKNIVRFIVGEIFDVIVDAIETSGDLDSTALSFASVTNTLTNLISNESNKGKYRELLGKAGTCNPLVEGLQIFYESNVTITAEIIGAMAGLCHDHTDNLLEFVDCGVVGSISDVLHSYAVTDRCHDKQIEENIHVCCEMICHVFDSVLKIQKSAENGRSNVFIDPFSVDDEEDCEDEDSKKEKDNKSEKRLCGALLLLVENVVSHDKDGENLHIILNRFNCITSLLRYSDMMNNISILNAFESHEQTASTVNVALAIACQHLGDGGSEESMLAQRKQLHCSVAWTVAYLCRCSSSLLINNMEVSGMKSTALTLYESNIGQLHQSTGGDSITKNLLLVTTDLEFFSTENSSLDHVKAVCAAVWALSHDSIEAHLSELGEAGACLLVQKIFTDFMSNAYLTTVAASTLEQLSRLDRNVSALKEMEILTPLTHVLRHHVATVHVTLPLCAVVRRLAQDSEMRSQLGQWGVCELVVKIAKGMPGKYLAHIATVMTLFGALLQLATDSESNTYLICEFDGIELVIRSINQLALGTATVPTDGVSSACVASPEGETENTPTIDDTVIVMLCELLELLLQRNEGNVKVIDNNKTGACDCMIRVLKTCVRNFQVVSKVAHILRRFVELDQANKVTLQTNDVATFLYDYYLAQATQSNTKTISDDDLKSDGMLSIYLLIGCLVKHPVSTSVMELPPGGGVLPKSSGGSSKNPSLSPQTVSFLTKECITLVTLIKQYEENISFCSHLVSLLLHILQHGLGEIDDTSLFEILFDMGICEFLVKVLNVHISNEQFASGTMLFFCFLCEFKVSTAIEQMGAVDNMFSTVLSCLQCHMHDCTVDSNSIGIINSALKLLRGLCTHFPNRILMANTVHSSHKQSVTLCSAITTIICDCLDCSNYVPVAHACALIISLCEKTSLVESTPHEEVIKHIKHTQTLFSEAGICRPLVNAVRNFSASSSDNLHLPAVMYASGILCGNGDTLHEKILKDFTDLSLDRQLILHLDCKDSSMQLSYSLCFALCSLANEPQIVARLGSLGICFSITQILQHNLSQNDLPSILLSLHLIKKMTTLKENCVKLGEAKTIELLVLVLQKYGDKNSTLVRASDGACGDGKSSGKSAVAALCSRLIYELTESASQDILEAAGINGAGGQIMYIMKYFLTLDVTVVLNCCLCVWSLTNSHEANRSRLCDIGVCSPLIQILKLYKDNNQVVFAAIGAARSVSGHSTAARQLVSAGLCELAMDLLETSMEHIDIVDQILGVLANIVAADSEARHLLVDFGLCEKLISCVGYETSRKEQIHFTLARHDLPPQTHRKYSDSPAIMVLFCNIVASLSHNSSSNAQFLTTLGAFHIIHEAMKQFSKVEGVITSATLAMKHLTRQNSLSAVQFVDDRAYETMMMLLELHCRRIGVVESALCSLYNVMVEINEVGGATQDMNEGNEERKVQEVMDISQLQEESSPSSEVEVATAVKESKKRLHQLYPTCDGLGLISDRKAFTELFVSMLRIHASSAEVTAVCCHMMTVLLTWEQTGGGGGGLDTSSSSADEKTEFHLHDVVDDERKQTALVHKNQFIGEHDTLFVTLLTHYGVVEAVAACLSQHVKDFQLNFLLFKIITLFCTAESKIQLLFGHQDIPLSINSLFDQYRESDTVTKVKKTTETSKTDLDSKDAATPPLPPPIPMHCYKALCIAISAITQNNIDNTLTMGASGICKIVASILNEFLENPELCAIVCDTICHLSYKCEENIKKFESLNVPFIICNAFKEHVRVPSVVYKTCQAIVLFSEVPQIRLSMSQHTHVCEMLIKAFVTHVTSDVNVLVAVAWAISVFTKFKETAIIFDNNKTCLVLLECLMENKSVKQLVIPVVVSIMELSVLSSASEIFSGSVSAYSSLIEIMHTYAGEAKVVEGICVALHNLVKNDHQKAKLVAPVTSLGVNTPPVSPPRAICVCIQMQIEHNQSSNGEFSHLLSLLVQLILSICQGSARNAEIFGDAGICEMLMLLLGNVIVGDNADLLTKIFKAIEVMGICKENKLILGQEQHCRALLKVIKNNLYDKNICISSCSAVSSICMGTSKNKEIFGENGFCSLVCELLRIHTDDASVIGAACAALWSFGSGNMKNTQRLSQIISISDLLIEVLKLHFDNALVCGAVSGLLAAILQVDKGHFPAMKSSKMQEICLATLTTYSSHASVVAPSLTLLRLIFQYEWDLNAELNPFSKHVKECACLVKIIQQFKTNTVILEEVCLSITILCAHPSSSCINIFGEKLNIFRLLPEVISVAIIDKNRKLASLALKVIALLCTGNSYNQRRFGETDACQVIIFVAQKLNPSSSSVSGRDSGGERRVVLAGEEGKNSDETGTEKENRVVDEKLNAIIELEKSVLLAICMLARHSSTKSSENTINIDKLMLEGACEFIMSIVENRLDNLEVVYLSFRAIFSLSGNDACSHRFNRNGICDIIAEVLNKYRKHVQLSHYICGVVANIAVIDDGNALLVVEKVPEAIVKTLQDSGLQSKDVATYAFVALNNLVGNRPKLRTLLGECGACKAIIEAVKMFQNDSTVLKTAISLIANLVLDNAINAERFIAEEAFQVVIDSAFQHVDDSTLCHSSFVFILSTSSFSKESIVALLNANVILLVSTTLKTHPGNGSIVDICCVATQYMLSGNQVVNDRVGKEIIDQNVPENLLYALKNHSNDLMTVQSGLKLLLAMMKTASSVVDKMVACGVLKYIWESLSFNPLPNTVASPVCSMISLVAHNDYNRILLKKQDLCMRLTNILELFIIDEKIIIQVCVAMQNVMFNCPENVEELLKSNVTVHLIKALNKHQLVKDVSTEILKVMVYLVNHNVQAQKNLIGEVLCLAVSTFYLRNNADSECAILCCNLIKFIARSSFDRAVLGKSGVCGVIATNIEMLMDSKEGIVECIAALHAMSVENKDNTEILGLKGACEGLIEALITHAEDVDFVALCLRSVVVLSSNRINAKKLTDCGACAIITENFQKYLLDAKVPRLTLTAVRAMSCICEESRVAFNGAGIYSPVVDCIKKNLELVPLVESACAVIMTLLDRSNSSDNSSSTMMVTSDRGDEKEKEKHTGTDELGVVTAMNEINEFRRAGGVEVINEVLNAHIRTSGVVNRVCNILINMSLLTDSATDIQGELGKAGICSNIVLALSHHLTEKVVNAMICTTIRSLCKDPSNRYTLGSVGACVVMAKLLQFAVQYEDLKLVVEVLLSIRALTEESCANQAIFGKLGTCDYISGLVGSENGIDIDLNALWCINFLSRSGKDDSTSNETNAIAFGHGQAFEGILVALQEHRSDDDVLCAGLTAFHSLCCVDSNIALLVSLGGCQIVTDVVKAHTHNAAVCNAGIIVLTTITTMPKYARNLIHDNALEVVSLALRRHEASKDIFLNSCKFIVALFDICPYDVMKTQFIDTSLCPGLVNNWRKLIGIEEVFEKVVNVIEKMCSVDLEMKVDFGSSGTLETIIRTVKLQLSSPSSLVTCTRVANRAIKALTDDCTENVERFRLIISGTELESVLTIQGASASASGPEQDAVLWESAVDME